MAKNTNQEMQLKSILFVRDGEPDGDTAIDTLKNFNVRIIHIKHKDEETVTPWLSSPIGNFYGLESIRSYVDYEHEKARQLAEEKSP